MELIAYSTSEKAWLELNKSLVISNPIDHPARIIQSNQVIIYDAGLVIERAYIDPNFSFTKTVNYAKAKWTSLVGNYIDIEELKEVAQLVRDAEEKKTKNYNYTLHFQNSHGHGKACLISCTFSRMYTQATPQLKVVMRASEFYKRGMMDLLLLQRVGEAAYGEENFSLRIHAHQLWGGVDWLSLLNASMDLQEWVDINNPSKFAEKVLAKLKYFEEVEDPDTMKYHAHARAAKVIQGLTREEELLVKHCTLNI